MISVTLETATGELVHKADMITFNHQPDVLLWGARFFKFVSVNLQAGSMTYRECFVFALAPGKPL